MRKYIPKILRIERILIRSTRNPRQNPERDEKREKEKKRRRILFYGVHKIKVKQTVIKTDAAFN